MSAPAAAWETAMAVRYFRVSSLSTSWPQRMPQCCWIGALFTQGIPVDGLPVRAWWMLLYLAIAATAVALLFQNVGQKYTDPSSAALLLSLEAPFGVAFSVLFGAENPSPLMYLGFLLIFLAVVCSETKFQFLRKAAKI